jgi:hypothetical protein
MKNRVKIFSSTLMFFVLLTACCCNNSKDPSAQDKFKDNIMGTWILSTGVSVDLGGTDVSHFFSGFEVTFLKDGSYTSKNGQPPIWPVNGFYNDQKNAAGDFDILRDDAVTLSIKEMTTGNLKLQFHFDAQPVGRINSVSGTYTFSLVKQ